MGIVRVFLQRLEDKWTTGCPAQKTDFRFNDERRGTLREVSSTDVDIVYGVKDYANSRQRKGSLSGFRFLYGPGMSIKDGKRSDPPNTRENYFRETEIVLRYPPGTHLTQRYLDRKSDRAEARRGRRPGHQAYRLIK